MSAGGQKQEVRFLAMAVGALVIAVALFVGVRSLSNKPATASSGSSAKKTQAKKTKPEVKKAEKAAPPAPSARDPFASVGAGEVPMASPRRAPARSSARQAMREADAGPGGGSEMDRPDLRLSGILRGSSGATAVVHIGDARFYATLGDQVGGYTLVKIGTNSVVLSQGGRYQTLCIQPEPGSGSRTRARTTNRRR
jgi:hypothetical protein